MKKVCWVVGLIVLVLLVGVFGLAGVKVPTIHIMMTDMRLSSFPYTKDLDQMNIVQAMEKQSGVDLRIEVIPHEEYPKKIQLMLSSGNLPDVYNTYSLFDRNFPETIHTGIAVPLDDYLDKYGPNLKAKIPEHVWDTVRVNGKIYAIPEVLLPSTTRRGLFVRKDWLDKLGVGVPQTVNEFIHVLRLFRDNDLNGNGLKDEIPYIGRQHLEWMEVFFGAYGVLPRGWHDRDGAFTPDILAPEFKEAVKTLRGLYADKLLDPEFIVNNGAMWEQKILSGRVGMWEHVGSWLSTWQTQLEMNHPGAEVVIIPAPMGPNGDRGTGKYPPYLRVWFVTRAAKDPAAVIKYFDWLISEDGQRLTKYGIRGSNQNGQMNWSPEKDPDCAWRSVLFRMVNDGVMDWEYEKLKDPVNGLRFEEADKILQREGIENLGYAMQIPQSLLESSDLAIPNGNLFKEYVYKIILGIKPLDAYDEFVHKWLDSGGRKVVDEATQWYKSTQKK